MILEQEAARIIGLLPRMQAGVHKGKKTNVIFSMPISYNLDGNEQTHDEVKDASKEDTVINGYVIEKETSNQKGVGVPFAVVDEVPVFPGCENAENKRKCFQEKMNEHIRKNFSYPKAAQEKGIQGRVSTFFVIQKDGSIGDLRMRGSDKLLEQETERIISLLPKMKPGKQKGEIVKVPFSIPVNFKLKKDDVSQESLHENKTPPLIIIDGKESHDYEMYKMNPDRIKSVNVLKGDAAKRKYGDKGKNGVIEIITKKSD
ncbi:TonB family protein [Costertonia aggregata]|uniref:TonB family protein n=2 Tax=Costertonia aggregata TaxID=343403 RepID=A0A7H9AUT3_9FLAO|nr:TonB family protein [Costertonia aggregata]